MSRDENPVFYDLVIYFQSHADELKNKALRAGINQNKPDSGDKREDILANFLTRHLPNRCVVNKGGFIFNSLGKVSKQIDIIILNDLSLQFREYSENQLEKVFNCLEGCYCAISVKSYLSKHELFDALDNMLSIPNEKIIRIDRNVPNWEILSRQIPHKIVFAYSGPDLETIKKNLIDYSSERSISAENLVDIILVNNEYFLSKVGPAGYKEEGQPFQEYGTFQYRQKSKHIGGIGLAHMLTRIQKVSNIGSYIMISFDEYYKQMKIVAERMEKGS